MSQRRRQNDRIGGKDAESAADDGIPMERFRTLARRELSVSNKEVQAERRRERKRRKSKGGVPQ